MSDTFTILSFIVTEVHLHSNGFYGTGRAELPILVIPLTFTFRGPREPGKCFEFFDLSCRVSPFESTYIAHSLPLPLRIRVNSNEEQSGHFAQLEIPLDRVRMALINRMRNGGDVSLRLDLQLQVNELVGIGKRQDTMRSFIWGIAERYTPQANMHVVIPRSVWLERVLNLCQFDKVNIIELPAIPITTCAEMKISHDALQQAVKLEGMGFYNEAVGHCRIALEPFFEVVTETDVSGNKKQRRILKSAWQSKLGQRTYDWLSGSFLAVSQAANQPHHPSSSNFDQIEAQMLLMITTALISYAIKTQPEAVE